MDIFSLTKSKTRQKILKFFSAHPNQDYYLRQLERELNVSAANIRRELILFVNSGLFIKYKRGRLIYYHLETESPLFKILNALAKLSRHNFTSDIIGDGFFWVTASTRKTISSDLYCQTRDVFTARLETVLSQLEKTLGADAYLLTAIIGEIGNNSFDHNLGNWPNIPGIFFAVDQKRKIIVLADRGQGIRKTIRRVKPEVTTDSQALNIAFTKIISGRFGEKRGNGLKFVVKVIKEKNWNLRFDSGRASLEIKDNCLEINEQKRNIKGCFAVIRY